MNPLLEKRYAVFALLVFSGVLGIPSYYAPSDGLRGGGSDAGAFGAIMALMRYGIYAVTIFLIVARLKSVIRPAMRDPFLWPLMVIIVTSFIWSDFPDISQKNGLILLQASLFGLYLASRYSLKEQVRIVAWAVGIAAVFSLLYTLALPGSGIEQGTHAGAWRGPLIQKNVFARFEVMSAPALLLVALSSRRYRYLVWTVFGISVALVQLSTSKSALLICITLLLLLPLYRALRVSDSLAVPFFITVILVGASVATWFVGNWEPFVYGLGKDPTLSGRTYIWDGVIEKIWERPWLGYGYDAFWQGGGVGEKVAWDQVRLKGVSQAHNGFIEIGAQLGILGLLCFVLSLLTAFIRAISWVRLTRTSEDLWPITYVTFLFMYNQTESTNVEVNSIFWILYVAVTLSLKRVQVVKVETFAKEREKEGLVEHG